MSTKLAPHRRGDTFQRTFTLGNDWLGSDFTGGVKFTLRASKPASSVVADTDAIDQASVSGGEISFAGAVGSITIPAARTTAWPTGELYFDIQGVVALPVPLVYTIDFGTLLVTHDITRST